MIDLSTIKKVSTYGWVRDSLDQRDWKLNVTSHPTYPTKYSLRQEMPEVYSQLRLGACTGNSTAGVLEHQAKRQGHDVGTPSRLWLYYQGRVIEHTTGEDVGAQIRDVVKGAVTVGCPPETDWAYSDANPGPFQGPPPAAALSVSEDNIYKGARYWSCPQDSWHLKWCVYNRYPVVFGFSVFEPFESESVAATGVVPMPQAGATPIGGHAVVITGWDDTKQMFEVRNSWSAQWGDQGYFWMPYSYALNGGLASDFWTIRLVV